MWREIWGIHELLDQRVTVAGDTSIPTLSASLLQKNLSAWMIRCKEAGAYPTGGRTESCDIKSWLYLLI